MSRAVVALSRMVPAVVLVVAGTYLLVYLYRWEWNRALVAGSFFIAAELALIGALLLRRLGAIERRLEDLEQRPTLAVVRETGPAPAPVFRWLGGGADRLQVFVPVLLGAGVILSLLAAGVERVAGLTARPAMERRLARRVDGLGLPDGGFVVPAGARASTLAAPATTAPPQRHRHGAASRAAVIGFAVLAGSLALASGIDLIADATQDRPDAPLDGRSEIDMAVELRFSSRSVVGTAEALVVACRHTISQRYRVEGMTVAGDGRVRFTVVPAIGEHATRRFVGCLEDAQFDRVSADVVSVRRTS